MAVDEQSCLTWPSSKYADQVMSLTGQASRVSRRGTAIARLLNTLQSSKPWRLHVRKRKLKKYYERYDVGKKIFFREENALELFELKLSQ